MRHLNTIGVGPSDLIPLNIVYMTALTDCPFRCRSFRASSTTCFSTIYELMKFVELTLIINLRNLYPIKISRIRELEILELMRKRDFATYVALWNGRDWQERKRHFSNSYKFKNL